MCNALRLTKTRIEYKATMFRNITFRNFYFRSNSTVKGKMRLADGRGLGLQSYGLLAVVRITHDLYNQHPVV
jgi:hypothetical protein